MEQIFGTTSWQKTLLIVTASFFLLMGGINKIKENGFIGKSPDFTKSIYVMGEGKVTAIPDVAKASFGYTVTKPTVAEAQKDNVDKMNVFIKGVKDNGIADKDIRTANFNINPSYNYTDGRQVLNGYVVSQNVEVTIRDSKVTEKILSLAASQGLNQVGGLNFTIDDTQKYVTQARVIAIKKAQENARIIADSANFRLGKLMNYGENYQPGPMPYANDKFGMGGVAALAPEAPSPTISSGSNEIVVQVNLTYEIQ